MQLVAVDRVVRLARAASRCPADGNSDSMPKVRASSGTIGTQRLPVSFSRIRSLTSRTNAMVVAIAWVPEPLLQRLERLLAARAARRRAPGGRGPGRRGRRGAPGGSGPRGSRRPGARTGPASVARSALSGIGSSSRSRMVRNSSTGELLHLVVGVAGLEAGAERVALHRLREDHRRARPCAPGPRGRPRTPCGPRGRRARCRSSSAIFASVSSFASSASAGRRRRSARGCRPRRGSRTSGTARRGPRAAGGPARPWCPARTARPRRCPTAP